MTTSSGASSAGLLRRDRESGWLGGVAAGIARRYGVDVSLVRLAFVVATAAGGAGIAAYALGWLLIPAGDSGPSRVRIKSGRAAVEVALGTGLLLVAVLLTFRALGIWLSDAVVWPLVLIASGGALIWRQSMGGAQERITGPRRAPGTAVARGPEAPGALGAGLGVSGATGPQGAGLGVSGADQAHAAGATAAPAKPRADHPSQVDIAIAESRRTLAAVSRTGLGIALVVAAGFVFLQATGALGAARDVLLALLVAVVVLGVILAPWIARLVRSLTEERAERIRSQERAEVAAHLHDSVLQTLAMVQRRAGEPGEVAALARRQERELRAWLADRPAPGQAARLAAALEAAAAEVEESHGVPVEVVVVGDRELDPRHEAIVAAAREAMTNAAKFGEGSPVDVYAESSGSRTQVFVRDRGPGFDTAAVPPDRRGVRESIVGRMRRHGGRGRITSSPGAGTEVELVLEERQ